MTAPRLDASAADIARAMSDMRTTKPRSLARMFGSNGPTDAQRAAHDASVRAWSKEYRALSKAHKVALVRDNAAFAAGRTLDATTLPEGTDGGAWAEWQYADGDVCDVCERTLFSPEKCISVSDGLTVLCLSCALAECGGGR